MRKAYGIYETSLKHLLSALWESQRKEKEKRTRRLFKAKIAENFPNLERDMNIQVHEARKYLNSTKTSLRHIIIKLSYIKDKEKILKAAREKIIITYRESP